MVPAWPEMQGLAGLFSQPSEGFPEPRAAPHPPGPEVDAWAWPCLKTLVDAIVSLANSNSRLHT